MRRCSMCKIEKNTDQFNKSNKNNKISSYCKQCQAAYHKEYYKNNKDDYLRKNNHRKKKISEEIRKIKDVPCMDCGGKYPTCVMDFDHVRGEKKFCISASGGMGLSFKAYLDEISKCDIVCANCHRIRTEKRRLENRTPRTH